MAMRIVGAWVAVVIIGLAACGRPTEPMPDGDPTGTQTTDVPEPAAVTLADVGGEDWPIGEAGYDVPRPYAPRGYDDSDIDALADALEEWSRATTLDPIVFTAADPQNEVLQSLGTRTLDTLLAQAGETAVPELYLANVWTEVANYEPPRVTVAWQAETVPVDDVDEPMLVVTLQTRAFYPIRTRAGEQTLIAIIRWHSMASFGSATDPGDYSASAGWATRGVDDCAILTERLFVPRPIAEHEPDEYDRHIAAMNASGMYDYPFEDTEDVNSPEYQQRCGTA